LIRWGIIMIDRVSVSALLKLVIAVLSAAVVLMLGLGAWDSWVRLNNANRIAAVANASGYMFTVLHNLRVDRATTYRDLLADKQSNVASPLLRASRDAEMPALRSAIVALETVDIPEQQSVISDLRAINTKLTALQEESVAALTRPKAERRQGLAQEYQDETSRLMETLDKLTLRLNKLVKLEDSFIDHLMEMKQLAWMTRNEGGESSVLVSNTLGGRPLPADAFLLYTGHVAKLEMAWTTLEDVATGLNLPPKLSAAIDTAKREYFSRDYTDLRTKTLKALIAGEAPGITVDDWARMSVARLATLIGVAEASLDAAKDYTANLRATATRNLWLQLTLLVIAALAAATLMLLVSRRVTSPLQKLQQAMIKLASGDLTAEVAFGARRDEIGALAGAMQTFKQSMTEAERLRTEQTETQTRASTQRKVDMQRLADEFQAAVGHIVDTVSTASSGLESAARTLTKTAETTQQLSGVVASASEDASSNVQSVATAAEEMAGSVNEIARQVHESSRIAAEAVNQAGKTDARITALSQAANRIGDVVKLITAIAEQTNLLALNATIEAARAGEAGKGFAVVAQEVKALAAQTAKATDEIGTQIASMQSATQESVAAIKEIGGTIGRISEIANAIAAAVEQQGAATQEISRNVQQAAQGTAQVATNITDVNRGASETGTASSQVLSSAQSLAHESNHLKTEVEKFVNMVRAA
jgi:methyl-accepting chemotaxis protein